MSVRLSAVAGRLIATTTAASAPANPPEPTAITDGPAAEIDAAIAIRSASVAASTTLTCGEPGKQRRHVARRDRRHRIAAECRALYRLSVNEQPIRLDGSSHRADMQDTQPRAHRDDASATPRALQPPAPAPTRASSNRFSERRDRRRRSSARSAHRRCSVSAASLSSARQSVVTAMTTRVR